jgi:HAD superfamily hydrolase (TIGR01509 family)
MPLRAVLFDLWETLIHDRPDRSLPRRQWRTESVCQILTNHGFDAEFETVLKCLDASTIALTSMHDVGRDIDSPGRALLFVEQLLVATGRRTPDEALPELEELITSMPLDKAPHLASHAVETVAGLKARGLATALVCNTGFTTAPHLRVLLDHYGLSPHFDALIFSDELQVAKPDPRIFTTALEAVGISAADGAFVGDNPHTDIWGALSAGLFTVQIGAKTRDGITPQARIDSLDELVMVLKERRLLAPE